MILELMLNGFFCHHHGKSPYDGIDGAVKHTARGSLQRPMNDKILNYESMLTLCQEETSSIKFFWYQQRNHDWCKKKSPKMVYKWKNYTRLQKYPSLHSIVTILNWTCTDQWRWSIYRYFWFQFTHNFTDNWYMYVQFVLVPEIRYYSWWPGPILLSVLCFKKVVQDCRYK